MIHPILVAAALAGTLSGTVADAKGNAIAGVSVIASSAAQTARVQSDATGHFSFASLAPGSYTVVTTKTGFEAIAIPNVRVAAERPMMLRLRMPPVRPKIEVTPGITRRLARR